MICGTMLISLTVNNDFHLPRAIFELFDGLTVKDIDVPVSAPRGPQQTNGVHETNGTLAANGNGAVATA